MNKYFHRRSRINKLELMLAEQRSNEAFMQERVRESESKNNILLTESERLRNIVKQRDDQLDELKSKITKLEFSNSQLLLYDQETVRLREIITERSLEGEQARRRVAELESQVAEQRRSISRLTEAENKISLLAQEIERLTLGNQNRLEEITSLRAALAQAESAAAIAERKARESVADDYEFKIEKLNRDNEVLNNKMKVLSLEIDRLNNTVKSRSDEIEGYKLKVSRLEIEVDKSSNQEEKINLLLAEIDRLNNQLDENHEVIQTLRRRFIDQTSLSNRLEEQLVQIVIMSAEIECMRGLLDSKNKAAEEARRSSLMLIKNI